MSNRPRRLPYQLHFVRKREHMIVKDHNQASHYEHRQREAGKRILRPRTRDIDAYLGIEDEVLERLDLTMVDHCVPARICASSIRVKSLRAGTERSEGRRRLKTKTSGRSKAGAAGGYAREGRGTYIREQPDQRKKKWPVGVLYHLTAQRSAPEMR